MGCCISTNTEAPAPGSASRKHVGSDEASSKLKGFRAPPPSSVEEETVKEVLSETPQPKPKPEPIFSAAEMKQDLQEEDEEEKKTKISAHKVEAAAIVKIQEKQHLGNNEEIMSQVSEICSVVSESVSTITDKRDNEVEEEQQVRQRQRVTTSRSQAKPPPRDGLKRDRLVNQSPTRKSEQLPARRIANGSVRLVQGQESVRLKVPERMDPVESSVGRSSSPATTRSSGVMGRSPSTKRTNRSPGRVRSEPVENTSRKMEGRWASNNNNDSCSTNESLENPFVSLECFIFL